MTRMPSRARYRFASLPDRTKLSTPKTSAPGFAALICLARVLPAKPQMPVIRTFMKGNGLPSSWKESSQILWRHSSCGLEEYLKWNFGCGAYECYFPESSFYLACADEAAI